MDVTPWIVGFGRLSLLHGEKKQRSKLKALWGDAPSHAAASLVRPVELRGSWGVGGFELYTYASAHICMYVGSIE